MLNPPDSQKVFAALNLFHSTVVVKFVKGWRVRLRYATKKSVSGRQEGRWLGYLRKVRHLWYGVLPYSSSAYGCRRWSLVRYTMATCSAAFQHRLR